MVLKMMMVWKGQLFSNVAILDIYIYMYMLNFGEVQHIKADLCVLQLQP